MLWKNAVVLNLSWYVARNHASCFLLIRIVVEQALVFFSLDFVEL